MLAESLKSPVKKAAIYARVSTTEQADEGYSIDEQVRLLKELCEKKGYEVYQVYEDRGISGKSIEKRPAMLRLLSDANQKRFNVVLVWKMNRIARKSLDLLSIVDVLDKNNISFRSYTEAYETETPQGKFQFQMMAAIAEYERGNIAENVKMGMLARAKEGSWNGGHVLGYDVVKIPSDNPKKKLSRLEVNGEEAKIVQKIFQLYIEGNGYKAIANRLNKEGYKTKRGNNFSQNGIKDILCNPIYIGIIRYNVRRNWSEKRRKDINPNPIMQQGKHEPIISKEVWDKARAIMKSRSGKPNRVHSGDYILTGILKCPVCGASMVLARTTSKRKDGSKHVLEYYVCGAYKNKGSSVCNSNGVRVDYANDYVLNRLTTLAENDRLIKAIVRSINKKNERSQDPLSEEFESIVQKIKGIQGKKDKLLEAYKEDIISKADLKKQLSMIESEKASLDERLQPIQLRLEQHNSVVIDPLIVQSVLKNFKHSFSKALTGEQRKRLLQLLINRITISESRVIDSIQIQLNKEVIRHFSGGEDSSITDESFPPFSIYIDV